MDSGRAQIVLLALTWVCQNLFWMSASDRSYFYLFVLLLGFKPRAPCTLNLCSPTDLYLHRLRNSESKFSWRDFIHQLCSSPAQPTAAVAGPSSPSAVLSSCPISFPRVSENRHFQVTGWVLHCTVSTMLASCVFTSGKGEWLLSPVALYV